MCLRVLMLVVVLACAADAALADAIVVDGVAYKNVYIRQSDSRYYILLPREGRSFSVSKDRVSPTDVFIDPDRDAREALLREWKENRDKRRAAQPPPPDPKKDPRRYLRMDARPTPPEPSLRSPAPVAPQTMAPLVPMEAAGPTAPTIPRPRNDGVLTAPRQPPGPRAPSVFPAAPAQQQPVLPTTQYPPMLRAPEPMEVRGIRERMQGVDEEGVPKLVLKGSQEKDPARERYILERTLEERARIAEEQRLQEIAYERFLWEQQAAANPYFADIFGLYPPDVPWEEQDRPPLQPYGSYPQQPMTQPQQPLSSWPVTPQPQAYGQQPNPGTTPGAAASPQEPQTYGPQPNPATMPGARTAPLQATPSPTPSGVAQPVAPRPAPVLPTP